MYGFIQGILEKSGKGINITKGLEKLYIFLNNTTTGA